MSVSGLKAVEEHQALPLQQQQPGEDERVEALAAAILEQQLAAQLRDVADVLFACQLDGCFSSVLETAATMGRHQLLAALLQRRLACSNHNDRSAPHPDDLKDLAAALLAAAGKDHAQCLRLLLDTRSSPPTPVAALLDARDSHGLSALMKVACLGSVECMQLLLEHSPHTQLAMTDPHGWNALCFAAGAGHAACLQLLLHLNPDVQAAASAVNVNGITALMAAAARGHTACLQLLLAHHADVQVAAGAKWGMNALMVAAAKGHAAGVQLLLQHSPDTQLSAQSTFGGTALSATACGAHVDCLQLLLSHSLPKHQLDKALLQICRDLAQLTTCPTPPSDNQRILALKRCAALLLASGAILPAQAAEETKETFRSINQELAATALVPDMANEAVVGLALAAASRRKQPAGKADAAEPSEGARPDCRAS